MSDKHANLDRSDSDITIDNHFGREHDSEIDAIPKDNIVEIDSICQLFESCLRRYGILLLALQTDALRSTHLVNSLVPNIKDEFSRLRIWGEQTYAVLPQNARRSLDEQLHEDEDTRKVVISCLRRLNNQIEKAIEQIKRFSPTADVDTKDEEYSSLSDESDTAPEDLKTTWEIRFRKTIGSIFEGIRSIYRVSVLLRRRRNSSKYLRSSNSTIPSHDALRVTLDYAHVSEKIRQWRYLTMRSRVGGDEEHVVTEEEIRLRKENEHQEIADIAFFCQRLTWANLFRRKQFDYWIDYPDVPETQTKAYDAVSKPNQQKAKIDLAKPTSSSTVARSALGNKNNTEFGQSRTVYAKSAFGRLNTTRVPDVPKCSQKDPNFECPFCHIILDSKTMQKRDNWKKHVFRDLRPYVCSFEECPDPGRLFITRHDWVYHEKQMHRRRWSCPYGCGKDLPSKADMVQHLLVAHSSNVDERQVSTYADMCEREMDDTRIDACLICSEEMSLPRLHTHHATHMEEVALFVLPMDPEDDEDELMKEITEEKSQYTRDAESISAKKRLEENAVAEQTRIIQEQKEQQDTKEDEHQASLLEQKEQQDSKRKDIEEDYIHSSLGDSSPPYTSPTSGISGRSSPSPVPQRDYILDVANPERATSGGNDPKWTQEYPATYQCTLCPKMFTRAYNLRSHLRTHVDERPFICAVCGKAFARQRDRERHESLHCGENKGWSQGEE